MEREQSNHIAKFILFEQFERDASIMPEHKISAEQSTAINDLIQNNYFKPYNDNNGPYTIQFSMQDNRMVFAMQNAKKERFSTLILSLKPYKRLIADYFLMIQSYEQARQHSTPDRLEAIDMGRRALHNEGAALLIDRLEDKIDMDVNTARRLFSLICTLHKAPLSMLR